MEIKEKYINNFFKHLTEQDKNQIYFDQYMWHVFSYKKIAALEGEQAVAAFETIEKKGLYIFFEHNNNLIEIDTLNFKELEYNINNKKDWEPDCYIVDKNFEWTFVFTHETNIDEGKDTNSKVVHNIYYIGPFFYKI